VRLLLVGPPGAGKGTQARRLAEREGVPHVASGDLLRNAISASTPLGIEAKKFMDVGDLVPDDVVVGVVSERLSDPDAKDFVLDGFPRTKEQALALDRVLSELGRPLERVIHLEVPDDEIVERLSARRYCPECHRVYHMLHDPPKSDEVCDDDGCRLVRRPDDDPETVRHRLAVQYHAPIGPLLDHYENLRLVISVDGVGPVDEVAERVTKVAEE
jgi:adenylate kinase